MFSRIIEMHPGIIREKKEGIKEPKSFSTNKPQPKKSLSKKLKESSLSALRQVLAEQKQQQELSMGAAGPFSNQLQQLSSAEAQANAKIDPSAQISQLFEKLVETLIQIKNDGIDETTFFLDGDAFSSSVFHGAKITITEYNTAPKIFNIEFAADSKTLAFFETHALSLISALREGGFGFGINRLDTSLLSENEKHALPPVERDEEKEEKQQ